MAVDIPVIVDIEKSFEDAAKRVKTAIKPLQEVIESAPASLFIDVKIGNSKKVLVELFDDARTSVSSFESALAQVSARIEKLAAKGGFNLRASGQLTKEEKNLLEAAGLLETKLKGVGNASSAMSRVFSLNMKKAEEDISNYMHQLDALQRKQNLSAKVSSSGGLTKPYQTQIDAVNVKLQETRRFLGYCSLELEKVSSSGVKATAAMGGMKTKAQEMAEAWRRGESYLARYNAGLESASFKMGTLVKNALSLMAIHAASSFIRNVREVTSEFEMQRVALGGIIQDTERAEKLFKQLKAAAIQSPFQIKDLVTFTKQLSAYRIETENLFDVTMKLADVSAGLGVDMNRLVLAYGQVRAASVLRGQELRQFTEAGIPLVEELARKFRELGREGTTTADVFELISRRAVPFKMIEDIFNDMTEAGGMFYKMQEKQSETLKGQWMKLRDALSIMYDEIGNTSAVHDAMEVMLRSAKELLENWREVGKTLGVVITSLAAYKVAIINLRISQNALTAAEAAEISMIERNAVVRSRLVTVMLGEEKAIKIHTILSNLYVAAKKRETMATNIFTRALWKMNAALLKNPYAIAAAAIVVLVAAIVKLVKSTREAQVTSESLQKTITSYDKSRGRVKDINELCQVYTELNAKLERTQEEEEKLTRVTKELAKAYPESISGINKETNALQLNIDKVKELTKAELELETARLRVQEKGAKKRLEELERDRDRLLERYNEGGHYVYKGTPEETFVPFTEKELAKMGERLREINDEYSELQETVQKIDEINSNPEEDAVNALKTWKKMLHQIQAEKVKAGATPIFTAVEIEQLGSVNDLYKKIKKEIKSAKENLKGLKSLQNSLVDRDARIANEKDIAAAEKDLELIEAIRVAFGFTFGKSDSLVSKLRNSISDITNAYKKYLELLKYMSKEDALKNIDTLFPSLAGWEPTYENMLKRLENLITAYRGNADATRLIEQAIANVKFDKLRDDIKDELSRLSNEIKHSKEAKSFYDNLLDMTGSEEMARRWTEKIYGTVGEEAESRQKELLSKLFTFDSSRVDVSGELQGIIDKAISEKDVATLRKYLGDIVAANKSAAESIIAEWEKHDEGLLKNFAKLVSKYGNTAQEIATIRAKANVEIDKVKDALKLSLEDTKLTPEERKALQARAAEIIKALEGNRDLEEFKAGEEYIQFFSELNLMTAEQASFVRTKLRDAYLKAFRAGSISADELKRNLKAIDTQFRNLTQSSSLLMSYLQGGFDGANAKLQEYADNVAVLAQKMESGQELSENEQNFIGKMLSQFGSGSTENIKSYQQLIEAFKSDGLKGAGQALGQMGQGMSKMAAKGPGALAIVDAIFKNVHGAITGIQQVIDLLNEVRSEENEVGDWFRYVSDFDKYTFSGWEKLKSGDFLGATADAVSSWVSIFTNKQKGKVKDINKQIKDQGVLLEDLEYAYTRLSVAIEKAFGSDYIANYNQQIAVLQAQAEAYRKQAELERKKGKSADENTARGYERSAREVEDQIIDMQDKISEFFTGSDINSAAESFANAWREAYAEFGDTADAIREKMEDMIHNLIEKSAMAGIVQTVLRPWYKELNSLTPEELDSGRIAELISNAYALLPTLNEGLAIATSNLEAAGVNMRQTAGKFSGISRDYATATEGAINGLAAGVNTQNFYISHVPQIAQNVALILAALNGSMGRAETPAAGVAEPKYMSFLPEMHSDLHEIRLMLAKVISPNGVSANTHYVATR